MYCLCLYTENVSKYSNETNSQTHSVLIESDLSPYSEEPSDSPVWSKGRCIRASGSLATTKNRVLPS